MNSAIFTIADASSARSMAIEASLLDVKKDAQEDPFVRRLVESFAFLTARVQLKLDDDFPNIASALLEQLFPLATRPLPAFTVVQLEPTDQIKPGGEYIARHSAQLTDADLNDAVFRNCYDARCLSVETLDCQLARDLTDSRHATAKTAVSGLRLKIAGRDGLPLNAALNQTLRFFYLRPRHSV